MQLRIISTKPVLAASCPCLPPDRPRCTRTIASAPNNARRGGPCPIPCTTTRRVSSSGAVLRLSADNSLSQPLWHRLFPLAKPRYTTSSTDVVHLLVRHQQNPHPPSECVRFLQRRLSAAHYRVPCLPADENRIRARQPAHDDRLTSRKGVGGIGE